MIRSELYINDTRVDLKSDFGCAITYAISDIRNPETRNGAYSKTLTLPGTSTIHQLMTYIFDINYDIQTSGTINFTPDFNPNLKASARVYTDGVLQFSGYMRLNNIVRDTADLKRINYEVTLLGEVATIYQAIGDKKMTDLSLSEYNHTYNKSTQQATWTNTNYGTGYVYPMINYGGIPANTWNVNNFYPAVYLKTYIDKIFAAADWAYSSAFFDSAFFKRLIVPYAGERLTITASQSAQRLFNVTLGAQTSGVTSAASYLQEPVVYGTIVSDPLAQYDNTSGYFTATNSGYYDFYASGTITLDAVTTVTPTFPTTYYANYYVVHMRGATTVATYPIASHSIISASAYTSGQIIFTANIGGWSPTFLMQAGDIAYVKLLAGRTGGATGDIGYTQSASATFFNRITNASVVDGGSVDMAAAIPTDVRQADFLTSVFRMFNLYVEPDRTQPNKLIIEPEPDFYESGSTRDWSKKLDVSKPVVITPMGALDAIRYKIKYSDDTDYWNKFYKDKYKESFGEKNVDVINDFIKNTKVNEVIFAPTPVIGSNAHDRIIPEIYSLTNAGVQQPIRSKLRILYWGGSTTTQNAWTYVSAISGNTSETTYPYSGHVDNPISPTVDLSFGVPREIYYVNPYGTTSYTNNNLYNQYHSVYIQEITDRNSKIVTAYFRLTALDIFNLSFRDIIYIDGQNYRLNKVIDYDPASNGVTKCELLKIKFAPAFVFSLKNLSFTYDEYIDIDRIDTAPTSGGNVGAGDMDSASLNTATGRDVYVSDSASGSGASGANNRIGNDVRNSYIVSSSGVVISDGLSNVTVIGTNDITITESNVTYINGNKYLGSDQVYTITSSTTIYGAGVYYCTGTLTLTMSTSVLTSNDLIQIYNMGTGTLTVAGGGINILQSSGISSATLTSSDQYDSITLRYNGTNYIVT